MTTDTSLFALAFKLLTLGFSVIPSGGGDNHKHPLVSWTEWQKRCPDEAQLERWEAQFHPTLWGVVTGAVSGVVVLDADTPEMRGMLEGAALVPHIETPRGGGHSWFKYPGYPVKTAVGILPGLDVRGDGGFVNVIGSRPDGAYRTIILPTPDNLYPFEDIPASIRDAMRNGACSEATPAPENATSEERPIMEGKRNGWLAHMGGYMRRQGMTASAIEAALQVTNRERCQPPLPEAEVTEIARSIGRYPTGNTYIYKGIVRNKTKTATNATENATLGTENATPLSDRIEEWVRQSSGWCLTEELDRDLGIVSVKDKNNRREVMLRLAAKGVIEKHAKSNKQFRFINQLMREIDFKHASSAGVIPLKWPGQIERLVNLYPGNLAVIAGATNAGKTAVLLNVIFMNQATPGLPPIYYFCSEMVDSELRERLEQFDMSIDDWNFKPFDRSSNFADVIVPDCINIVDYLELTEELYLVNSQLTAITQKLGQGIAIVAIQKKEGAKYGRGQEFSAEKSKLYVSLDKHTIRMVKGKSWAVKGKNPNGLIANFEINNGCDFRLTKDWHLPAEL